VMTHNLASHKQWVATPNFEFAGGGILSVVTVDVIANIICKSTGVKYFWLMSASYSLRISGHFMGIFIS
jgi:hypothetical protein